MEVPLLELTSVPSRDIKKFLKTLKVATAQSQACPSHESVLKCIRMAQVHTDEERLVGNRLPCRIFYQVRHHLYTRFYAQPETTYELIHKIVIQVTDVATVKGTTLNVNTNCTKSSLP